MHNRKCLGNLKKPGDNLLELFFSYHYVNPCDQILAVRLNSRYLYLLSHFSNPHPSIFINRDFRCLTVVWCQLPSRPTLLSSPPSCFSLGSSTICLMLSAGTWLHCERDCHLAFVHEQLWETLAGNFQIVWNCGSLKAHLHWSTNSRSHLCVTFRIYRWMLSSRDESSTFGCQFVFRDHTPAHLDLNALLKYETGEALQKRLWQNCLVSWLFPLILVPCLFLIITCVLWFLT